MRFLTFAKLLLVTLFLVTRFTAVAHSTEYGNGQHEHNGKLCVVALLAEDDDETIAVLPENVSFSLITPSNFFPYPASFKPVFFTNITPSMRDPPLYKSYN